MNTPMPEPFSDNWAYIKTELNWLDRVLVMAVGRHRRDLKEAEPMIRNPRDRVTRHWWKGVITLDQSPNYDEYRPGSMPDTLSPGSSSPPANASNAPSPAATPAPNLNRATPTPMTYQDQLAARIQTSRQQGVLLGLPALQERLGLTTFEKNLVLLSLAPEVNRRFSRLYGVLQESEQQERPLVDLAFKLFCRNDQEWQVARVRLGTRSPLVHYGFLSFVNEADQPLLTQTLKLRDDLVNFLLAEHLNVEWLEALLQPPVAGEETEPPFSDRSPRSPVGTSLAGQTDTLEPARELDAIAPVDCASTNSNAWDQLVVPLDCRHKLQKIALRFSQHRFRSPATPEAAPLGGLVLFNGPQGTGKTLAAKALAQAIALPLYCFNLHHYSPEQYPALLQCLRSLPPAVVVLEAYHLWLGRRSLILSMGLQEWIHNRRLRRELIIAEGEFTVSLPLAIRRIVDEQISFSRPDTTQRLQLWQQAFSRELALDFSVNWPNVWAKLAHQYQLTGAEIYWVAQEVGHYTQAKGGSIITPDHIHAVIKSLSISNR